MCKYTYTQGTLLTLLFLFISENLVESARGEISLAEIRAMVSDEINSLHSIRVKYTLAFKSHPPYKLGDGTSMREWIRQGDQRLTSLAPSRDAKGNWYGMLVTYDGHTTHSVVLDTQDPTKYAKVGQIRSFSQSDWTMVNPESFIGLSIMGTQDSLATLLGDPATSIVGHDVVDGMEAVHIALPNITELSGVQWKADAWLSPQRHYLPIKLHFQADPDQPAAKKVGLVANPHFTYRNLAWGQFVDKSLERQHEYPTHSEMDCALSLNTFKVTDLSINETIPLSTFQPQPQFGTEVIGRSTPNDPKQTVYIAGGDAAIAAHQRKLIANALNAIPAANTASARVDARPREGLWMSRLWKTALTASLLTIAYYFYRIRGEMS